MPIPDFQEIMRPLLSYLADGKAHTLSELYDRICKDFKMTDAEINKRTNSGRQTIIRNRVGWARTYLHKANLITIPNRGEAEITERGLQALKEEPARIDVKYLKRYPEFLEFIKPKQRDSSSSNETEAEESTPEEQLDTAHKAITDALIDDLLNSIKSAKPTFFEQLVVDLMLAMGYGGSRKDAGEATRATNDDGIDGTIKEDRLGLDTIYLQAKRWQNTVQRPEIDKFIGSLTRNRARKGVFITTSEFSPGAREAVQNLDMKVVLIDGLQLAELMIEHNLGVTRKEVYEVKQIDNDYFSEDN
jgi:restriction system protein